MRFQPIYFIISCEVMKHPNFNVPVKPLVLERTKDEVRVVVVEVEAKQILVEFGWTNLSENKLDFLQSSDGRICLKNLFILFFPTRLLLLITRVCSVRHPMEDIETDDACNQHWRAMHACYRTSGSSPACHTQLNRTKHNNKKCYTQHKLYSA